MNGSGIIRRRQYTSHSLTASYDRTERDVEDHTKNPTDNFYYEFQFTPFTSSLGPGIGRLLARCAVDNVGIQLALQTAQKVCGS